MESTKGSRRLPAVAKPKTTPTPLSLAVGVKSDPIEYRYSFSWLFRLMKEEGVRFLQLGTFFELYHLPDEAFLQLRAEAEAYGICIRSLFTAHRELGGFFRKEAGYEQVARRCYERLIEVGALLGASAVGSNPGAVLRDEMDFKPDGLACYVRHMKELMHYAHEKGVRWLTIEPMSCLAEPPTTPDEIRELAEELNTYHAAHLSNTARVGYCVDIAHAYIDKRGALCYTPQALFEAALPALYEIHLKNTDARFEATFGFSEEERLRGVIEIATFRDLLYQHAHHLPVSEVVGYLEIGGPKRGRDYTDPLLETQLRSSLRYLKQHFTARPPDATPLPTPSRPVRIAPSMMCADQAHLADEVRELEMLGVDWLHMDIMDTHFVPNMPLGLTTLEHLRALTRLSFDVHLMVEHNELFIERLAKIGVQSISVHAESTRHLDRVLSLIRAHGIQAGVALNPATPLSALEYVRELIDFVLIMTVNPGFAGQVLTTSAIRKISDCRRWLDERGFSQLPIQVDGNVSFANIPRMVAAGADILVVGSSSLFAPDRPRLENMRRIEQAIREGMEQRQGGPRKS
ncbi:MAG TPA: ribulose-phosphate 3-epimerase [Chthonomonas sp.]|uniref:ribulose-phosphate 3-epimerase n=1 Tax=Chthonomonas sp. TaxID=2282153 RepID=UPI002B4B681E|nr:ribulose-phosphate 3-epimerase [Chthonomonas sp.]HLI47087.1 ribulose-phosphate 3-epimerase [Chthonomonas sp.]